MTLQDMIDYINNSVDDVVITKTAVAWLNAGQNKMAQTVGAKFPQLDATLSTSSQTFAFDDKWHEIPVLYAAAMFKGADTSLQEKNIFMQQFNDGLKEFVMNWEVLPSLRDDRITQQFIATDQQTDFTITKNSYDPSTGDLVIYVNDIQTTNFRTDTDPTVKKFYLNTPSTLSDKVTAVWEEHTDLVDPPYSWWQW